MIPAAGPDQHQSGAARGAAPAEATAGQLTRPGRQTSPPGPGGSADPAGLAEVARGSSLNLVGVIISAAATLGTTIIVTRQFSRPVAGAFFTATSLFLIVEAIANLGAYNGAIYFIARLRSVRADSKIPAMLRAAALPVAVASVASAAAMLLLAHPLARLLLGGHLEKGGGAAPGAVADSIRALAITLPFAALLDTFLGASRGFRAMLPTVAIERIGRSSLQLLGLLVAAAAGSAALLAPLWSLPYIPASIAAWLWLRRIRRRAMARGPAAWPAAFPDVPPPMAALLALSTPAPPWEPPGGSAGGASGAGVRSFWAFTAPRALATVAQIVIQRLDIVLVAIIRGPVAAAVYATATRFLVVGQLGNVAIIQAAQPQFSHLFAVGDRRGASSVYQATTGWLIVLTWPLYLLSIIYGPEVLAIFGHSYRAGSTVMVILGLAMLVATGCGQVDMVLTTTGRSSWSLANGLLAVTVNVGVDLALIPRYGITGAAIGWAAAIGAANLIPLVQVAWVVRVHPFGRGLLAATVLTTLSFGALPLLLRAVLGTGLVPSLATLATGCVILVAGLWRFRDALQLSVMPGLSSVIRRASRRRQSAG
ncbi:MAG: polysaccharide biosynthesis C-terminal domain-containing protein [Actinomycetota bacterium]